MTHPQARYPGRAPIEAYGNGGFRFAGMSHRGSILCLPSGIEAWDVIDAAAVDASLLQRIQADGPAASFVLFGTGRVPAFPSQAVRDGFKAAGIGLEIMDTGAAARTYNILLAENRPVAAALIAVD
jgi:uncharacterized protein